MTRSLSLFLACVLLVSIPAATSSKGGGAAALRVLKRGTDGRSGDGAAGRRRGPWIEVATDKKRYEEIWGRELPGKPDPSVDFDHETAVFLLLGPQQTGGYAIEPISVDAAGDAIKVRARLVQPMTEKDATDGITVPYAAIAIGTRGATRLEWIDADGRLLATRIPGD